MVIQDSSENNSVNVWKNIQDM